MSRRLLIGLLGLATITGVAQAGMIDQKPLPQSLYDRLGGSSGVDLIADEFMAAVAADSRLNGRFSGTDGVPLRTFLVDGLSAAAGGPGPSAAQGEGSSLAGPAVTDTEFDALTSALVRALEKRGVAAQEQGELVGILGRLRPALRRQ